MGSAKTKITFSATPLPPKKTIRKKEQREQETKKKLYEDAFHGHVYLDPFWVKSSVRMEFFLMERKFSIFSEFRESNK